MPRHPSSPTYQSIYGLNGVLKIIPQKGVESCISLLCYGAILLFQADLLQHVNQYRRIFRLKYICNILSD